MDYSGGIRNQHSAIKAGEMQLLKVRRRNYLGFVSFDICSSREPPTGWKYATLHVSGRWEGKANQKERYVDFLSI